MLTGSLKAVARPLVDIVEAPFAVILAYWSEAKGSAPRLRIADLRPERFASALPYTAIVERTAVPRSGLRIRLCGSDIENRDFGLVRGAYLEDVQPDWYRAHLVPAIAAGIAADSATYQRVEATLDGTTHVFSRLMLPLSSDGVAADAVLVASMRPSNRIVSDIRAVLSLA